MNEFDIQEFMKRLVSLNEEQKNSVLTKLNLKEKIDDAKQEPEKLVQICMSMCMEPGFAEKFWDAIEEQFPEDQRKPNPFLETPDQVN